MSAVQKPRRYTVAEYLALENAAETKSEYYDGEILAMAGASRLHNRAKENVAGEIYARLKGTPCESYTSDQRLRVLPGPSHRGSGLYTYPDVMIVCGIIEFDPVDPNTITNPVVIVEVLSPSTENYDRGLKLLRYQGLPSVREIVLVSQDMPLVQVYTRQADDRWLVTNVQDMAGEFSLTAVSMNIPLADVYRGVEFPPDAG